MANDTRIHATATDACHDNHIRSPVPTGTCDVSRGNHWTTRPAAREK